MTLLMGMVTNTEDDLAAGLFGDSELEEVIRRILQSIRQAVDTVQGLSDNMLRPHSSFSLGLFGESGSRQHALGSNFK